MADILEAIAPALRIVYGRPEVVEAELNRLSDSYACTNLFYYVVETRLEVAATLISMKEIRKAQFAQAALGGNQIRR